MGDDMKVSGFLLAAMVSVSGASWGQTTTERAARIEALFSVTSPDSPGCAAGVSERGQTVIEQAFGLADIERNVPNTTATLFETGSVSKQFTAAAVLLLERDGKLKLSDNIRIYLPEMPDYGAPITIEMLLNHTSGLRDWGSVANAAGKGRGDRTFSNAEVLDIVLRQKALNYSPGAEYSYTNTGYNLAAIIVERVSGKSLMDFTRERLFEPLGMTSAQWRDDHNRIVKNRALAYDRLVGGFRQSMPFMNAYGNGGLMMTITDLTRWNEAMMADTLGLRAAMEKRGVLSDGRRIPYARGVGVQAFNGVTEIAHSGSTGGYSAWLARYPDRKISVAILCNTQMDPRQNAILQTAVLLLGDSPEPEGKAGLPDPAIYAGRFVNTRTGVPVTLAVSGGDLQIGGRTLLRVSETKWKRGDDDVTFLGADRLQVESTDGNRFEYVRTAAVSPAPAQLAEYAGVYASDEAMARYTVSVEDGKLKIRTAGWPDGDLTVAASYRDAFTAGGILVRFRRDPDGKITEMSFGDSRMRDLRAARLD